MYAYLGGFFDGEGCVVVGNNGAVQVRIINTNKDILNMYKVYGAGSVAERKQKVNKQQYVWSVYGEAAEKFLGIIANYTIDKRPQILVALNWISEKRLNTYSPEQRKLRIKEVQEQLTQMKKA